MIMVLRKNKKNIKILQSSIDYLNDRIDKVAKENAKLIEVLKVAGILEESDEQTYTFTDDFGFYKQVFKVNEVF